MMGLISGKKKTPKNQNREQSDIKTIVIIHQSNLFH